MDFIEGEILPFWKPLHWTSFDLVGKVRAEICHKLHIKKLKVGHTGTLDPLAEGVVVICTGRKTKMIEQLQEHIKEYEATLQFGSTTPSFDLETEIDAYYPTEHITAELINETLSRFKGEIMQVPPVFSAVKIDGKRAYEKARKGEQIELKAKRLVIDSIELLNFDAEKKQAQIRVVCSKGTYIRALARDIGTALNSGAHLVALKRTQLGEFRKEDCLLIENFRL
ncbi:MAG: tRNA pseudouridine(55) synthase TruB [Paludibacteraceae bacterium]|nr:tRNA pseudouridine(55) synthase TruB [Paludibacteraceae bacterium]